MRKTDANIAVDMVLAGIAGRGRYDRRTGTQPSRVLMRKVALSVDECQPNGADRRKQRPGPKAETPLRFVPSEI